MRRPARTDGGNSPHGTPTPPGLEGGLGRGGFVQPGLEGGLGRGGFVQPGLEGGSTIGARGGQLRACCRSAAIWAGV